MDSTHVVGSISELTALLAFGVIFVLAVFITSNFHNNLNNIKVRLNKNFLTLNFLLSR